VLTAHRIALKPNNKQATYFAKASGTARFAAENQGTVGVDLGVSALATLSTGDKIAGPKAHRATAGSRPRRSALPAGSGTTP